MFHNGLKYDGKNDEPCDMFPENNGEIHPLHDFPKNRREEIIEHLLTSRVKYQDLPRSNNMSYIGNNPQVEIEKERLKVERERLALDREKFEWQKNQERPKPNIWADEIKLKEDAPKKRSRAKHGSMTHALITVNPDLQNGSINKSGY